MAGEWMPPAQDRARFGVRQGPHRRVTDSCGSEAPRGPSSRAGPGRSGPARQAQRPEAEQVGEDDQRGARLEQREASLGAVDDSRQAEAHQQDAEQGRDDVARADGRPQAFRRRGGDPHDGAGHHEGQDGGDHSLLSVRWELPTGPAGAPPAPGPGTSGAPPRRRTQERSLEPGAAVRADRHQVDVERRRGLRATSRSGRENASARFPRPDASTSGRAGAGYPRQPRLASGEIGPGAWPGWRERSRRPL